MRTLDGKLLCNGSLCGQNVLGRCILDRNDIESCSAYADEVAFVLMLEIISGRAEIDFLQRVASQEIRVGLGWADQVSILCRNPEIRERGVMRI